MLCCTIGACCCTLGPFLYGGLVWWVGALGAIEEGWCGHVEASP